MKSDKPVPLAYECSARKGVMWWALLLVGLMFVFAAYSVDPLKNCDETGNCAPWLVPLAGIMGWCATAMALGQLWANPRHGYRIEAATGDLVWWKNRTARNEGDIGRIHPSAIASIRVDLGDENESVSLYEGNGERLAYFDTDLLPWPYDRWAERFQRAYPHIRIDRQA